MFGMKKNRIWGVIGAVALTGVLAACTVTPWVSRGVGVQTGWEIGPNEYVMCDNFDNTVSFTFRMADSSMLREVRQVFEGNTTNEFDTVRTVRRGDSAIEINGNEVTVSHTFSRFMTPLESESDLETNAIVIVPVNPAPEAAVIGETQASYRVLLDNGLAYNFPGGPTDSYYSIPVWGACTR